MIVAGGANDGEVLARYGNRAQGSGAYDWFNQHYVDAPLLVGAQDNVQGLRSAPAGSLANAGASLRGGTSGMSVTVLAGQTLADIARMTLGDARQWYRIAQANALASDADLKPGMVLQIPGGGSATVGNTTDTFRPYDPTRATGELSPTLPMPAAAEGCGQMGQIIAVIVAVVVTYITWNPEAGYEAAGAVLWAAEDATTAAALSAASDAAAQATLTNAMTSAVAGNLAAQMAGNWQGVQDGLDWKSVAMSAISAGVSQGVDMHLGELMPSGMGPSANVMAKAAIANALTQSTAVVLGLQRRFDWRGVVASAVGAGVGNEVGEALRTSQLSQPAQAGVRAFAAGMATALARGGKVEIQQIATNAFGQALGTSVAETSQAPNAHEVELIQSLQAAAPPGFSDPMPSAMASKFRAFMRELQTAMRSDEIAPYESLSEQEQALYTQARSGTRNSHEDAMRIAPFLARAQNDPDLAEALSWGGRPSTAVGPRPADPRAGAAYDSVYASMSKLLPEDQIEMVKRHAYEASLLAGVAARVDAVDEYISSAGGLSVVSRALRDTRNAMAAALAAKDVYYDVSVSEVLPKNLSRGEARSFNDENQSGYFGALYHDQLSGKVLVANRGTEFGIPGRQGADGRANLLQAVGMEDSQYTAAMRWATDLSYSIDPKRLVFIGHSLGGGLASAQAMVVPGSAGITFNAAGLHPATPARFDPNASLASNGNITAYHLQGEGLTTAQYYAPALKALLSRQPAVGAVLAATQFGPQAVGTPMTLNAVTEPYWMKTPTDHGPTFVTPPQAGPVMAPMYLHGQVPLVFSLWQRLQGMLPAQVVGTMR